MSFAATFLLFAQSASPAVALPARETTPVAVSASASVRVLRPAIIWVDALLQDDQGSEQAAPQRSRDRAGTVWIEFN